MEVFAESKTCARCKEPKKVGSEISIVTTRGKKYVTSYCKACWRVIRREWLAKQTDEYKAAHHRKKKLKQFYGITPEEYADMLVAQDGRCAGCREPCSPTRSLAIDHDHKTGEIRGLLRSSCNQVVGFVKDRPETLEALAGYLRQPRRTLKVVPVLAPYKPNTRLFRRAG